MTKILLGLVLFFYTDYSSAKVLVVSDVDDTIKISHSLNVFDAIDYADETDNLFLGMRELYQFLDVVVPLTTAEEIEFVYLSAAPDYLMGDRHAELLRRHDFPHGRLELPSSVWGRGQFKLNKLREILFSENYSHVILIGDNGEKDAAIYNTIANEFKQIRMTTFIHQLYTHESRQETGKILKPGQIGYLTPIEIMRALVKINFLSDADYDQIALYLIDRVLTAPRGAKRGELSFVNWMDCRDFRFTDNNNSGDADYEAYKGYVEARCSPYYFVAQGEP